MHLETRLRRLEARYAATAEAECIRIVRLIVEANGDITEAIVHARDGTVRRFERLPTETQEELRARALSVAAYAPPRCRSASRDRQHRGHLPAAAFGERE